MYNNLLIPGIGTKSCENGFVAHCPDYHCPVYIDSVFHLPELAPYLQQPEVRTASPRHWDKLPNLCFCCSPADYILDVERILGHLQFSMASATASVTTTISWVDTAAAVSSKTMSRSTVRPSLLTADCKSRTAASHCDCMSGIAPGTSTK